VLTLLAERRIHFRHSHREEAALKIESEKGGMIYSSYRQALGGKYSMFTGTDREEGTICVRSQRGGCVDVAENRVQFRYSRRG
jgi:hypothetical protein